MLISSAYAQATGTAPGGLDSQIMSFLPLVLIFVVFYFLLIRPQQKRMKQHKEMLGSIRRGDRVVTNGGLIGLVTKVTSPEELILEIADGVRVRVLRSMVANVLAKTEPAESDDSDETVESKKP
jgi:preprotein translocase subunit YajC